MNLDNGPRRRKNAQLYHKLSRERSARQIGSELIKLLIIPIIVGIITLGINLFVEKPIFNKPTVQYFTQKTFLDMLNKGSMRIVENDIVQTVKSIPLPQSLIGCYEFTLSNDVAADDLNFVFTYKAHSKYIDSNKLFMTPYLLLDSDSYSLEGKLMLKSFANDDTLYFPFCITRKISQEETEKITSDFLNNVDGIIVKYELAEVNYLSSTVRGWPNWVKTTVFRKALPIEHMKGITQRE